MGQEDLLQGTRLVVQEEGNFTGGYGVANGTFGRASN